MIDHSIGAVKPRKHKIVPYVIGRTMNPFERAVYQLVLRNKDTRSMYRCSQQHEGNSSYNNRSGSVLTSALAELRCLYIKEIEIFLKRPCV